MASLQVEVENPTQRLAEMVEPVKEGDFDCRYGPVHILDICQVRLLDEA